MPCVSKEAAGNYQNGKKNYELRMRYELHSGGQVFHHTDLEEAFSNADTLYEPWELFLFVESDVHKVPHDEPVIEGRKKKQKRKLPRPTIMVPLLPYDKIVKAAHWHKQRISKNAIVKHLYCSVALFDRSIAWYNKTGSQEEYESYNDRKKNLVESK
jgi:hypothetical protein